MKKLLSILGSIGLVATASTAVVSCTASSARIVNEITFTDDVLLGKNYQGYHPGTKIVKYKNGQEEIFAAPGKHITATLKYGPNDDGYYDFKTGKVKGFDPNKVQYSDLDHDNRPIADMHDAEHTQAYNPMGMY